MLCSHFSHTYPHVNKRIGLMTHAAYLYVLFFWQFHIQVCMYYQYLLRFRFIVSLQLSIVVSQ